MFNNKIMLIITEQCNMDCIYCYEHKKSNSSMTLETAIRIIEERLKNIAQSENWLITYFGGEPFLNFRLINDIDIYIKKNYAGRYEKLNYSLITNGTILNDKIRKWLIEHRGMIDLQLSLDGYRQIHDQNRPLLNGVGSFDKIDLTFFKSLGCSLKINTVISPLSISNLADGIKWMTEQGYDCRAEFAIGVDWSKIDFRELWSQIDELIHYYSLVNPASQPCLFLRKDMNQVYISYNSKFRPCGVCREALCYDIEGNLIPCSGMSFVSVGDRTEFFKKLSDDDFVFSDKNICRYCEYSRVCKTCFAANYHYTGDLNKQSSDFCMINKICIYASAKIIYNRYKDQPLSERNRNAFYNSKKVIKDLDDLIIWR